MIVRLCVYYAYLTPNGRTNAELIFSYKNAYCRNRLYYIYRYTFMRNVMCIVYELSYTSRKPYSVY